MLSIGSPVVTFSALMFFKIRQVAFRSAAVLLVSLTSAFLAQSASAQWQHLNTFSGSLTSIYFQKGDCTARTGFVGTEGNGTTFGWAIYKTSDGGLTWKQVQNHAASATFVSSFSFKDSLTGWCSIGDFGALKAPDAIWKTTDGGETWKSLKVAGAYSTVFYHNEEQKLYATAWNGRDIYSTDDGASWTVFSNLLTNNITPQHNSVVFTSRLNGVISSVNSTPNLITTDGGRTWNTTSFVQEMFSPLALSCSTGILAAAESQGLIYRSNDGGKTWSVIQSFPSNALLTGVMVGDDQHLFIQSASEVLMSVDLGVTWKPIGGPGNYDDSRMYVRGGFLFAGSDNGDLYRYQYDNQPQKLGAFALGGDTMKFPSKLCGALDQKLTLTASSTCSECMDSVRISNASISGSTFFTIVSQPDPSRGVSAIDSIVIEHRPAVTAHDTATLTFTSVQFGQASVHTVTLLGSSTPRPAVKVGFWTDAQQQIATVNAGDVVHTIVHLVDPVQQSLALNTVSFDIPIGTSVELAHVQAMNGWSIVSEVDNANDIAITMGSSPHDATAGEAIAQIDLRTDVGTDATPVIPITGVHFNASDPTYETCSLTPVPATDAIAINFNQRCGDSTIRTFLDGKPLVTSIGISPDPVLKHGGSASAILHVKAGVAGRSDVTITSMAGVRLLTLSNVALQQGDNRIPLDLSTLAEGAYFVAVGVSVVKVILQAERP